MSSYRVCVAVLVLQVWSAVWARPSQADGVSELSANLLDRNTILNSCPNPPDAFSTPAELAGDWCELQNSGESNQPDHCNRVTYIAVAENIRVILNTIENGRIVSTRNMTFSKLANESWLSRYSGRTTNMFFGLSTDGKYLRTCGTSANDVETSPPVRNMVIGRCQGPGDEARVAAGELPHVERCDLPSDV